MDPSSVMDVSVVERVLVHMTNLNSRSRPVLPVGFVGDHQAHCWALRQQARVSLATVCGGRRVVAPGFGGGVWCLIRG